MSAPPPPPDVPDEDIVARFRDDPLRRFLGPPATYAFTRFAILRLLGLVYFVAFLSAAWQSAPLLGPRGLLPADALLARMLAQAGSRSTAFRSAPTLFLWTGASDAALSCVCWAGALLSLAVLAGVTNAL